MSRKKPTGEEVRGLLIEGHFGVSRDLPPAYPIMPTHMHLDIGLIKPYEHNPRRARNPMYEEIKASIEGKRGIDDPIGITRRPGEELFTVRAGGNTRLAILKELLEATGDAAFSKAYCLFVPWVSESDCIAAHLIENELRGELLFVDKALAVMGLLKLMEEESQERLSQREYAKRLQTLGYPISRRQMSRYEYVADVLATVIPYALEEGLGGHTIDEIRKAEELYLSHWQAHDRSKDEFDAIFRANLAKNDSDELCLELALEDLDYRIAEALSKPAYQVTSEIEAIRLGTPPHEAKFKPSDKEIPSETDPPSIAPKPPQIPHSRNGLRFLEQESNPDPEKQEKPTDVRAPIELRDSVDPAQPRRPTATSPVEPDDAAESAFPEPEVDTDFQDPNPFETTVRFLSEDLDQSHTRLPRSTDLKSLRGRARVLATRIAQSMGYPTVIHTSHEGYGFFVDVPGKPVGDNQIHRWAWWLLFSLSEQAVTKARLGLAPMKMRLPDLLIHDRLDQALAWTGPPLDAIHTFAHTFTNSPDLPDRAFRDVLLLMETCRTLRANFSEETLWHCPTIEQSKEQSKGGAL